MVAATLAACAAPSQRLDVEPAVYREPQVPACITRAMEARYAACDAQVVAPARPHSCKNAVPKEWPRAATAFVPARVLRDTMGRDPRLEHVEALFDRTDQDAALLPKIELAYRHVRSRARSREPAHRYASYMLAHVAYRMGDLAVALERMRQVVVSLPRLPASDALAQVARRDFVALYARAGRASDAHESLKLVADGAVEPSLVEDLAEQMTSVGRHDEAVSLLVELRRRRPDRACLTQARIVDVRASAQDSGDERQNELSEELSRLLDDHLSDAGTPNDACATATARRIHDTAWRWWERGMSEEGSATSAQVAMARSANSFTDLLATFSPTELRAAGVCTAPFDMAYARAELLARLSEWRRCATAFDYAVFVAGRESRAPGAQGLERLAQAAHGAVLCHQRSFAELDQSLESLTTDLRIEATLIHSDDWRELLVSLQRFLCIAKDDAWSDAHAEAAYARADAFYEGGALWEAAVGFRMVARRRAPSVVGREALGRYVQVLMAMGAADLCGAQLRQDVNALYSAYCAPQDGSEPACTALATTLMELHGRAR